MTASRAARSSALRAATPGGSARRRFRKRFWRATIAAELTDAKTQGGKVELINGRHKDNGAVVPIRDDTRCMILVDEPAHLGYVGPGALI